MDTNMIVFVVRYMTRCSYQAFILSRLKINKIRYICILPFKYMTILLTFISVKSR